MELFVDFEMWLRSWGAADNTIKGRLAVLSAVTMLLGDPRSVTAAALGGWLGSPRFSPWTRVAYYHHLKSLFGWMEDTGRIAANPMRELRPPKTPKDRPRPLTPDEASRALAASHGNLRAWLLLGMLAGLRAHEIAKIRGQDVDQRSIFVLGKGQQQAFIPTHPDLWVLALSFPSQGYWFPGQSGSKAPHVAATSVSTLVTRLFRSLGIEGSVHRCRHSYATNLLRNGTNIRVVQELMRHESLATTAKYTAVGEDERMLAIVGLSVA